MNKQLIPCIYLADQKAKRAFRSEMDAVQSDPVAFAQTYGNGGADEILVYDFSKGDEQHDAAIAKIKEICQKAEVPVIGAGNIQRMEDVKKLLYAGCKKVVLNFDKASNRSILEEVSKKFGKEKIVIYISEIAIFKECKELIETYGGMLLCTEQLAGELLKETKLPLLLDCAKEDSSSLLKPDQVQAITGSFISDTGLNLMELKQQYKAAGIPVNVFESKISWSEFKLNSDGMIPVVVQDHQTDEVLMVAYMNEEAFHMTLDTGKMTYWSRSREELWTKGSTSGHFQYVKSLMLDCDRDTILAKVSQIGPACHTGSHSCFFRELMSKEYDDTNPLKVFGAVYDVIADRKIHPKEGSYTNYLFEKGIDKILKKVGEECTEIVIAAKNPDKEEIKYEISDFLYHVMVLMVEKGVTWEEITRELARR